MYLPEWMRRRKEPAGAESRPVLEALKAAASSLSRLPTLPDAATRAMCRQSQKSALKGRGSQVAAFILPAMRYSPPHECKSLHEYLGVQ